VSAKPSFFAEIVPQTLFDEIPLDARWLPFLRKIGKAPEQLAPIKFKVTLPQRPAIVRPTR
jgi:hypothetical protein